jgi:protein-ribulosamine 3-kinase
MKDSLELLFKEKFGESLRIKNIVNINGGTSNISLKVETYKPGPFFIKYNHNKDISMFEAEAKGLSLLGSLSSFYIPKVYQVGITENFAYIMLEYIESIPKIKSYWEEFGEKLADLHRVNHDNFGLDHNNYIGTLPQSNTPNSDWIIFFIHNRLMPQVEMAIKEKRITSEIAIYFEKLYTKLSDLLVVPNTSSLLHGDLWIGNVLTNTKGSISLIDTAVYYGNREMELAFTTLFGGFDKEFYSSYYDCFPLEPGYKERFEIYNLYPLMVHVNLFGGSYLSSVIQTLKKFIN